MKKFIITIVSVVLMSTMNVYSQSCIDAVRTYGNNGDSIPPPGTIGPAGPSMGCLSVVNRQVWFYIPICHTKVLNTIVVNLANSPGDTMGVILYGPMSQKVSNCADLDASKIIFCVDTPMYSTGGGYNINVNDTLYEGNYYYVLLTFSDGFTSITSTVSIWLAPLTYEDAHCFECNNKSSVLHGTNDAICLATVDTAINKCKIIWGESPGVNLEGYKILRESSLTGIYDTVAYVPLSNLSEFTDNTSSPVQKSYTYSVLGYDSCNNSLSPGLNLTTIHLLSFAGTNNVAQLIWNNIYTANAGFEPQYFIHRYNSATGWQLIDSIGITLPTITYADIFAPAGLNSYTVELRKTVTCVPMRVTSTAYQSVFSNVTYVNVTNVEELANSSQFNIFPNPATSTIQLTFNTKYNAPLMCEIINVMGKKVYEKELQTSNSKLQTTLDVSFLAKGMYVVRVGNGTVFENKKLVVE